MTCLFTYLLPFCFTDFLLYGVIHPVLLLTKAMAHPLRTQSGLTNTLDLLGALVAGATSRDDTASKLA